MVRPSDASDMSVRVRKTEHAGAKKGQGAFWGPKRVAKAGSNRLRREQEKAEVARAAIEAFKKGQQMSVYVIVVLEFPSVAAWEAFYTGPVYQALKAVRDECSSARLRSVEG